MVRAVALEHNGDVYSCDHFVTPDHLLGNINDTHVLSLTHQPAPSSSDRVAGGPGGAASATPKASMASATVS